MEFPDYIMKKIEEELFEIINDINYYKNKKDLIRFIIRLDNIINENNRDIFADLLKEMIIKLKNINDKEKLEKIEKIIFGFLLRNIKEHTNKIKDKDCTIYEYNDSYKIYVHKPINIKEYIEKKFPNLKVTSIKVDDVKWRSIDNLSSEDIKNSKTLIITLKK